MTLGVLTFGDFELDVARCELRCHGRRVRLERIPMDLLVLLVEHHGVLVTREEIIARLWGHDTFVDTENNINAAIRKIRLALKDSPDQPVFVRTITGRGYCFIASVRTMDSIALGANFAAADSASENRSPPDRLAESPVRPTVRRAGIPIWLTIPGGLVTALLVFVGFYLASHRRQLPRPIQSIAVLPLENLSGDPTREYFSDGMTDELIGEVARIGSVRVISRTSIMQYKAAHNKSLQAIARELNVQAIVEGTVSQSGNKVRITAQLIQAESDRHIWSGKYEREVGDILALQAEVARAIAREIEIKLTPEQQTNLTRTRQVKPEAFEAYLKARFYLHKGILGLDRSIEYFREAIKLDSNYAEAHAGLAEALCYAGIFELRPSGETYPEARTVALKALELDESNAAAHNALADVKKGYDWDLAGAITEYRRALHLNPSHLFTRLWYAECLARLGRHAEALAEADRALALDPVSPISHNLRAMLLWRARHYREAVRESQQVIELDPNFVNAYWWQGLAWAGDGDFDRSIACLMRAIDLNDRPLFRALLGHVYGRAGRKDKALAILNDLTATSRQQFVSPVNFALIYAGLGDADATFLWLEKAYVARTTRVHELSSPCYDSLRSDSRYANLMRRIGLPL